MKWHKFREEKMIQKRGANFVLAALVGLALGFPAPSLVRAHCDTIDGPVVMDAQLALKKAEVSPVLKWVKPADEAEVRAIFKQTLAVRTLSKEAQELADRYFFENLVRLHRASEGEPYTGLKPAGLDPGPAVKGADQALESGSVEQVVKMLTQEASVGISQRFTTALEKKRHAAHSVNAGREFVQAYVEFVHYVEKLHDAALGAGSHHPQAERSLAPGHKHH
jgi:hypothetical protein